MTALRGRLVSAAGLVPDGVVAVTDGLISYAGPAAAWTGPEPEQVDVITPGLVDLHCHGGGGHSFTSGSSEQVAATARHHVSHGTTTMLASLVSAPTSELTAGIAAVTAARHDAVLGVHLEGPWLAAGHCGAHDPRLLATPSLDDARTWLGTEAVRMVTLAPELDGAAEVTALLEGAGVLVGLGHTDADAAGFGAALARSRVPLVTHLFNGMAPLHHRRPGPVAAALEALARGAAHVELIADGVHLDDATVRTVFAIGAAGVVLVSDAMTAAGMPDGDYTLGTLDVRVESGRATTRTDPPSLAGSTAHLADVVRRCVVHAGIDPVAAVTAATATPAGLLGLTDRGSLVTGQRADLVVLDGDWRVRRVVRGGREVQDRIP